VAREFDNFKVLLNCYLDLLTWILSLTSFSTRCDSLVLHKVHLIFIYREVIWGSGNHSPITCRYDKWIHVLNDYRKHLGSLNSLNFQGLCLIWQQAIDCVWMNFNVVFKIINTVSTGKRNMILAKRNLNYGKSPSIAFRSSRSHSYWIEKLVSYGLLLDTAGFPLMFVRRHLTFWNMQRYLKTLLCWIVAIYLI
jgi:hypothetical protein